MAVVYLTDQGSTINKSGDRIIVKKGNSVIRWILAKDIEQLILLGNIALSAQCATYLLKNRIDTVFLTYYGEYKGRLVGEFGKNVLLRIDQFRYLEERINRLCLASEFVKAKIINGIFLLQKRNYKYRKEEIAKVIMQNKAVVKYKIDECTDFETLRGYEGIAAKNYFSIFPHLISNPDFPFAGRNKRPPKDEVNALLSLCYTFLLSHILSKVYLVGLDPYYGSLHELDYGRQSLVLDLMEEFRPLVDDMLITMINKRDIRKEHFVYNRTEDEEFSASSDAEKYLLPVSMNQDGMKKVIYRFSSLLDHSYPYPYLKGNYTLNQIILSQARRITRQFLNKEQYEGFILTAS